MDNIKENLQFVYDNIESSAKKSGRRPEDITLIAVTKTVEAERIKALLSLGLGVTDLGENKVQEMLPKMEELNKTKIYPCTPYWHMIGHLQTNKVKSIIDKVSLIQSVDSVKVADEINKQAAKAGVIMDILIEVNIADETTKNGIDPTQIDNFIEHLYNLSNICMKGFMCIAPYVEKEEKNRKHFEKMMNIYIDKRKHDGHNVCISHLSMGMTNDYRIAIEEGATMIRVGTGIFGKRS